MNAKPPHIRSDGTKANPKDPLNKAVVKASVEQRDADRKANKKTISEQIPQVAETSTGVLYRAVLRNFHTSPRKVRLVAGLIRNQNVVQALGILDNVKKGSSPAVKNLLKSAISNAERSSGGSVKLEQLKIKCIFVNQGRTLKRWRARAYGRSAPIRKRSCHVTLKVG